MIVKLVSIFSAFLAITIADDVAPGNQVVCYYDSKGSFRTGEGNFHPKYLEEAAQYCTHLVYGYAAINSKTYTLEPMNPGFDVYQYKTYKEVLSLKQTYPKLQILLSVGGGRDLDCPEKYLTLLEYPEKRQAFVSSATELIKKHGFDGIDLAWQFPPNKPKITDSGFWSSTWNTIKSPFVSHVVDAKSFEHKQQFAEMVGDLKSKCRIDKLTLSLSVLPNVNSTLFFNIPQLIHNVDMVNLWAFDFYTPERNPKEADIPAPLYEAVGRRHDENGDYIVHHWCENGAPPSKLFLGIPTFARTWKATNPKASSCNPPITDVKGPGHPGPYTKEAGLLSYREVFNKLKDPNTLTGNTFVKKHSVIKQASYALFASEGAHHKDTWAGYEDPGTASTKADYARYKGLGGVAILDLTLDDFKGVCTGHKYPILRSVLPEIVQSKEPMTTIPSIGNVDIASQKPEIIPFVKNVGVLASKPEVVSERDIEVTSVKAEVLPSENSVDNAATVKLDEVSSPSNVDVTTIQSDDVKN